ANGGNGRDDGDYHADGGEMRARQEAEAALIDRRAIAQRRRHERLRAVVQDQRQHEREKRLDHGKWASDQSKQSNAPAWAMFFRLSLYARDSLQVYAGLEALVFLGFFFSLGGGPFSLPMLPSSIVAPNIARGNGAWETLPMRAVATPAIIR